MPNITARDKDGKSHFIWIQERPFSCGLACAYMLERKAKLMSIMGGEGRLRELSKLFPAGFKDGFGISNTKVIADVLNLVGVNAKYSSSAPGRFPFIANIQWNSGGGHFLVAVGINSRKEYMFYDPIYGLVELSKTSLRQNGYTVTSNVRSQRSEHGKAKFSGHYVFL